MPIRISLALVGRDYAGIIFPLGTGTLYTNQVGGTSCAHPVLEGFFVLLDAGSPEQDPYNDIYPREYTETEVQHVAALLSSMGLHEDLEAPLPEACPPGWRVGEAWVPVKVKETASGRHGNAFGPLAELRGCVGILTYVNSD